MKTAGGTSAHAPLENKSASSNKIVEPQLLQPVATALLHGHTGHVRFLTSIKCPQLMSSPNQVGMLVPENEGVSYVVRDSPRKKSSTGSNTSSGSTMSDMSTLVGTNKVLPLRTYVISGGDGFEDFSGNQSSDTIGRDDSTNHLLLW
jgi:hypothetical protein